MRPTLGPSWAFLGLFRACHPGSPAMSQSGGVSLVWGGFLPPSLPPSPWVASCGRPSLLGRSPLRFRPPGGGAAGGEEGGERGGGGGGKASQAEEDFMKAPSALQNM